MNCPKCLGRMVIGQFHGRTVNRCEACDGMLLDQAELGPILRIVRPHQGTLSAEHLLHDARCPKCSGHMPLFDYAHDSGVKINKCDQCGCIWLGPKQLEQLARYRLGSPSVQRLAEAFEDEFQISMRFEWVRRLIRSRPLSALVAASYLAFTAFTPGGLENVVTMTLFLLLPMACIWFSDSMGTLTGISLGLTRPRVSIATPGDFVAIGGWLLLACPVILAVFVNA